MFDVPTGTVDVMVSYEGFKDATQSVSVDGSPADAATLARWKDDLDVSYQLLAEKDPIAMQMFEAYNKVPMPNMRLSNKDAEDILLYLEEESRRVATVVPTITDENGVEREAKASCCEKSDSVVVGDETAVSGEEPASGSEQGSRLRPLAWIGAVLGLALGTLALRKFRSA